jgi:hypothetical protein
MEEFVDRKACFEIGNVNDLDSQEKFAIRPNSSGNGKNLMKRDVYVEVSRRINSRILI